MANESVPKIIVDILSEVCEVDPTRLTAETTLADLAIDSIELTQVLVTLEARLDIELPYDLVERLEGVRTIGDVCNVLRQTPPLDSLLS